MEPRQRISTWSRSALWLGVVWIVLCTLVASANLVIVRPWERGAVQLLQGGGVVVAVTLVVLAHVVCLVQAIFSLVGIGQCLLSQGTVIGLKRAYVGMMLTGLGSSGLVFDALLHVGRIEPMAVAVPAVQIIVAGGLAWRERLREKLTSLANTSAEQTAAAARPRE